MSWTLHWNMFPSFHRAASAQPQQRVRRLRSRSSVAGFTLVELFAVVIIVAIIAMLAIPAVAKQMKDRRTRHLAEQVADHYRSARMRALGRGGAILVRFVSGGPGTARSLEIREAVRGGNPIDPNSFLPVSSCTLTNWNGADLATTASLTASRRLYQLDLTIRSEYSEHGLQAQLTKSGALAGVSQLDVCFTPMGRALVSEDGGATWATLSSLPVVEVSREEGGVTQGLTRTVALLPNGAARLGIAEGRE